MTVADGEDRQTSVRVWVLDQQSEQLGSMIEVAIRADKRDWPKNQPHEKRQANFHVVWVTAATLLWL